MSKTIDGRLAYVDLFRVFALVGVIVLHVALRYLDQSAPASAAYTASNLYSGLTRWCVPAFAMLSGALLLDPKKGSKVPAFALRLLRLVLCICLWSALYVLIELLLSGRALTVWGFLAEMEDALLGDSHGVLWFLYIILGFYILSPILRALVRGASRAELHYALILSFLVAMLLPTLLAFFPNETVSLYLDRLQLYPVLGFFFYFIAGYYFRHYTIGRVAEALIYVLGVIGVLFTIWGASLFSRWWSMTDSLLFHSYLSPNVALTAVAFFVLFRYVLGVSDERGRSRGVTAAARCAFGTFLIHEIFYILFAHLGLFSLPIPTALAIPLWTAVLFLPSFALSWLLRSIPVVGKYIT